MDLCAAYLRAKLPEAAERQLRQAVDMGYYLPGLVCNHRACIAALNGDYEMAITHLETAARHYPHRVVLQNLKCLENWMGCEGARNGRPPDLRADHDFETACVWRQPEFPDPLNLHLQLNRTALEA
jgi:Flp pilus assembly protein TadD